MRFLQTLTKPNSRPIIMVYQKYPSANSHLHHSIVCQRSQLIWAFWGFLFGQCLHHNPQKKENSDLMSKKVKGNGFDSYPREDDNGFKHQTLVQNYLNLQKEMEAARNKLEAMKLKKLTLEAQVRFLRRRHKFLVKNKSCIRQEHTIVKPPFVECRKISNEVFSRKEVALQNMNHNGKPYAQKKNVLLGIPSHVLHGMMDDSLRRATQAYYSNQTNPSDVSKETPVKTRPATFDLNQISREEEEEEELQERYEAKDLVRSMMDEKLNDLTLLTCGNVGRDASTSQARKRKISWQDPVALRV